MWQAIKNTLHIFQATAANIWYRFPSRKLTIIGVTGTDGKTTTSSLIYHILNEAGYKTALVTSVSAIINGKSQGIGLHVTTPRYFALRSYIRKARKLNTKYLVLEVTSHALDQHRVSGIHFDVGVLTNITREHLDYHKTYEKYVATKAKLLKKAKVAVINKDDQSYRYVKKHLMHNRSVTYGLRNDSQVNPHNFPFRTKLIGKFNQYNSLAAIAALRELHIPDEAIRKGILSFKLPQGRLEIVWNKDYLVINDFAHTPNSFANVLPEVKKMTKNRLIHVFGSAAKRDIYKRPEMGKISSEYSNIIILTAEDPRDEPVEYIIDDLLGGIKSSEFEIVDLENSKERLKDNKKYIFKIPDRKDAINFAISHAQKGDTVLMTGKGHEKSINYGNGEEAWDESEVALEAINKRGKAVDF